MGPAVDPAHQPVIVKLDTVICLSENEPACRGSQDCFSALRNMLVLKKVSRLPNGRECHMAAQCDKTLTCTALCLQLKLTKLATLWETLSPWSYCQYLAPSVPAPVQCKIRHDIERIFRETHLNYP